MEISPPPPPSVVPERPAFPGVAQSLGLLGLVILFGVSAALLWLVLASLIGDRSDGIPEIDAGLVAFVNAVAFGSVCFLGFRLARRPLGDVFSLRSFDPRLILPILILAPAIPLVLDTLVLLPFRLSGSGFPEGLFQDFLQPMLDLLLANKVATFVAVVLVAPLTEEFFFRGLLLGGFVRRYGPGRAILFSTLLFALAHGNPIQLPATLVLGFYLGWLTLRTRSLFPAMLAHALHNGVAMIALASTPATPDPETLLEMPPTGLLVGAAVALVGGFLLLRRLLPPAPRV